ncbi:hypothetical protein QC764_122360 [Podospora pseudoanserina]|uniref:RRM domain-containing protein n=1 Tax=Podospora pseudoanserina TaxID=2609844 RepID=A0ABR0ISK5_9PEZI|nr:hypothetical protein QC764_122360 [Podospora pseudoanserina]
MILTANKLLIASTFPEQLNLGSKLPWSSPLVRSSTPTHHSPVINIIKESQLSKMNSNRSRPDSRAGRASERVTFDEIALSDDERIATVFHPMKALANRNQADEQALGDERESRGFSRNYRGDMNNPKNQRGMVSDNENTSLFITRLPADVTPAQLLKALAPHGPFGRVWSVHIIPANADKGQTGAAAKLIMFDRAGAEAVYNFIHRGGLSFYNGSTRIRAIVSWNQVKSPPSDPRGTKSRVLIISGPADFVDVKKLRALFSRYFIYQEEEVKLTSHRDSKHEIEFRFCCFHAQAEAASVFLGRLKPSSVCVKFGADPLAQQPPANAQARSSVAKDRWALLGQRRRGGSSS